MLVKIPQIPKANPQDIGNNSPEKQKKHYDDVIMTTLVSKITSLTVVYSIVYSGVDQRKHQSPAPLAFVRGIHRGPVNSPHIWPVTWKMFPFDDVIMKTCTAKPKNVRTQSAKPNNIFVITTHIIFVLKIRQHYQVHFNEQRFNQGWWKWNN